ncbi:MAG: copper transporter [Gaiella sp.]
MFDLRYHVASLAAVFIALAVGILVGIGLSGQGFVDDAERRNLNDRITELQKAQAGADELIATVTARGRALEDYVERTYPALVPGRLTGKRLGLIVVGRRNGGLDEAVREAIDDAGGRLVRVRVVGVPLALEELREALDALPPTVADAGSGYEDLGEQIGRELVVGGKAPLLDALEEILVVNRSGPSAPALDGIVVARTSEPQRGETEQFLSGLYRGVGLDGAVHVGIERARTTPSTVPVLTRAGLSTVDSVDTPMGQLALVLLLAGAQPGSYGVERTARDGVLPPVPVGG